MNRNWTKSKAGLAGIVVASTIIAGSVATASAQGSFGNDQGDQGNNGNGYAHSQCADGMWRNFKNPDGSMKFKNQGQCIKFFRETSDNDNQGNNNGNGRGIRGDFDNFRNDFAQFFLNFENWWHHNR